MKCPHCQKTFPQHYWGVSGKAGGYGTIRKPGLAKATFERHKKACRRRTKRMDTNEYYILEWKIFMGGSRKGANIALINPERKMINGKVNGWLDADKKPSARLDAQYCVVQRWSWTAETNHIPDLFIVPLEDYEN